MSTFAVELDKPGGLSGFTDTADISSYSDFSLASPLHPYSAGFW